MSERSIILRMLADEIEDNERLVNGCKWAAQTIAVLVDDVEDLRAEWAKESADHGSFVQYLMDDNTNTRLTYRDEVKAEFTEERDTARAVIFQHENTILRLNIDLAEAQRQKVAAFERNAELETAAPALEALIRKQTDTELIRALHAVLRLLQPPRAPSVPRRDAFVGPVGTEVQI